MVPCSSSIETGSTYWPGNDTVYARGRSLHEGKRLLHFHWGENGRLLEADVRDQQVEHVRIRLNEAGLPVARSCSCKEHDTTAGQLCRHEVTLLLEARERQREREAYGSSAGATSSAGPLNLHTLLVLSPNPSQPVSVELEIGTAAPRPVLNIFTFLREWKTGTGPRDPSRYTTAAQRLLQFLCEKIPAKSATAANRIFTQTRTLSLTGADLPTLLTLAAETEQATWTDVTRQKLHPLQLPDRTLPGSLFLDAHLHLHLKTDEPLIFLNDGLTAFQVGHRFFTPTPEALHPVEGILGEMKRTRRTTLPLTPEEAFRFISDAVPHIQPFMDITLSPEAVLVTTPAPLEPVVVLGWTGHTLTGRILFKYGTWETDPLHPVENDSLSPVRDRHRETRILNRFRHAGFLPVKDRLALSDDESQYLFLRDILPKLRKEARVETQPSDEPLFRIHPAPLRLTLSQGEARGMMLGRFTVTEAKTKDKPLPDGLPRMIRALALGQAFYRETDGRFFSLESGGMPALAEILADPAVRISEAHASCFDIPAYRLPALALLPKETHEGRLYLAKPVAELASALSNPAGNTALPALPKTLDGMLRDYQKTGWRWLGTLAHYGFGGILADGHGPWKNSANHRTHSHASPASNRNPGVRSLLWPHPRWC